MLQYNGGIIEADKVNNKGSRFLRSRYEFWSVFSLVVAVKLNMQDWPIDAIFEWEGMMWKFIPCSGLSCSNSLCIAEFLEKLVRNDVGILKIPFPAPRGVVGNMPQDTTSVVKLLEA